MAAQTQLEMLFVSNGQNRSSRLQARFAFLTEQAPSWPRAWKEDLGS